MREVKEEATLKIDGTIRTSELEVRNEDDKLNMYEKKSFKPITDGKPLTREEEAELVEIFGKDAVEIMEKNNGKDSSRTLDRAGGNRVMYYDVFISHDVKTELDLAIRIKEKLWDKRKIKAFVARDDIAFDSSDWDNDITDAYSINIME